MMDAVVVATAASSEPSSSYKQLYHSSVDRYGNLQEQLEKYHEVFTKSKKITELKNKSISLLLNNKAMLDEYQKTLIQRERALVQREQYWKDEMKSCLTREEHLQKEHTELLGEHKLKEQECEKLRQACAGLLVTAVMVRAQDRVKDELMEEFKQRKASEAEKLKKKFSKYSQSMHHKYNEVKESLKFSEAERTALEESNKEIESQLRDLKASLEERNSTLGEASSHTSEKGSLLPLTTLPEELNSRSCCVCPKLREHLDVAIAALNHRSSPGYGDLLRSNFILEHKMNLMELKMAGIKTDYQQLTEYIQEYKARSTEKVNILKENIKKADEEISELDKLVETVREAMYQSKDLVKQSPELLRAFREIEGTIKTTEETCSVLP